MFVSIGPLPLEPSAEYSKAHGLDAGQSAHGADYAGTQPGKKLVPEYKFRVDELYSKAYRLAVHALYAGMPHQYIEDGMRFRTLGELVAHTDACLAAKRSVGKRQEKDEHRQWYCTREQWTTNFGVLSGKTGATGAKTGVDGADGTGTRAGSDAAAGGAGAGAGTVEEFIVPADEHFTRCPVSKEAFDTIWDDEEGSFMYRNAVKVLVTEAADAELYKQGQPTEDPHVRYLIVHKPLVLDGWLKAGKAESLGGAKLRYGAMGSISAHSGGRTGAEIAASLAAAVEDDEDDDDVFVMLEFS
jgi:hypothetical protein